MMMQSKLLSSSLTIIWICDKLLVIFYDKNIHWLIWMKIEKKNYSQINGRIIVCKIVAMMKMRRTSHQKVDTQDINEKYITWTSQKKSGGLRVLAIFDVQIHFFCPKKFIYYTANITSSIHKQRNDRRKMAK